MVIIQRLTSAMRYMKISSAYAKTHVSDEKSPGSRLAKSEKTQFTYVNEYFLTTITACPENRERNWGFRAEIK